MNSRLVSGRVRLGFVGLGVWGRRLLGAFERDPRFLVEHVCDRDPARGFGLPPHLRFGASLEELLRAPIDAVAVAVDPREQAQVARRVLQADKHLFVEKPLALSVAEAEGIGALARSRGSIVCVGHVVRYHPIVRLTLELLAGGAIGPLRAAWLERSGARPRVGVSPWWVLGAHDFSLLGALEPGAFRPIGGGSARLLWAEGDEERDRRVGVRFSSGWFAELRVSGARPPRRGSVWVGEAGVLELDEKESSLRRYAPTAGLLEFARELAREPRPRELDALLPELRGFPAEVEARLGDALENEIDAFARGLLRGEPVPTDVEDGCAVVRALALGARSPARSGGGLVPVIDGDVAAVEEVEVL